MSVITEIRRKFEPPPRSAFQDHSKLSEQTQICQLPMTSY